MDERRRTKRHLCFRTSIIPVSEANGRFSPFRHLCDKVTDTPHPLLVLFLPVTVQETAANSLEEDSIMKKNVGSIERVIRIFAGIAILSLAFMGPKSSWAYLGFVPLATGLIGWCPPYSLFGFSTCKNCK